jgi:hypothetical protein
MRANSLPLTTVRHLTLLGTVIGACCGLSAPASASILWTLTGTFDDTGIVAPGTVAPGSYFSWTQYNDLDSTNGSLFITTTNGNLLPGFTYAVFGSFPDGSAPPNGFVITNNYFEVLSIEFEYPLTTPGIDPIVVGPLSYECLSYGCPPGGPDGVNTRYFTGGFASSRVSDAIGPAPLPAALPLFASGVGGLSFLGWWRKRKARPAKLTVA